jgi:integral membrane sensor domain MASE1
MDFSGIGMMIIACIFMVIVPPFPAAIALLALYLVRKAQDRPLNRSQIAWLVPFCYALSVVACCFFIYYSFLRFMYVM